mgnify:CR=1 FL=1
MFALWQDNVAPSPRFYSISGSQSHITGPRIPMQFAPEPEVPLYGSKRERDKPRSSCPCRELKSAIHIRAMPIWGWSPVSLHYNRIIKLL